MKIGVPVQCHNGHKAVWIIEIKGLEVNHLGVLDDRCDCPKCGFGEGYEAKGEPFIIDERS